MKIQALTIAATLLIAAPQRGFSAADTEQVIHNASPAESSADSEKEEDRAKKAGGGETNESVRPVRERDAYVDDLKGAEKAGDAKQVAKDKQGIREENQDIKEDKKIAHKKHKKHAKAKSAKVAKDTDKSTAVQSSQDSK